MSPIVKLKRIFSEKIKEMEVFNKNRKLDEYDSNTLSNVRK